MQKLEGLLLRAQEDPAIAGVMLFGSAARGEAARDLDVALVLRPASPDPPGEVRLRYLEGAPEGVDVQVFQTLPIYVRARVLMEGKVLLARDEDALYEVAFRTVREWGDFRPFYEEYLEGAGRA